MSKDTDKQAETLAAFNGVVNMTPASLKKWLDTPESNEVGWKGEDGKGSGESVGHQSGRHIIAIQQKKQADLTEDDYAHMVKVISYVKRHMAQGPAKDVEHSRWRYSLMNWGHDPLKK